MKKTLLVLLIALMTVSFVFAEEEIVDEHKVLSKVEFGVDFGFIPNAMLHQIDTVAKAEFTPFNDFDFCTLDGIIKLGAITDMHQLVLFNGFIGAGATKYFGDFKTYINLGFDALVQKGYKTFGGACNVGAEFTFENGIALAANVKVTDYFKDKMVLYTPSLGIRYTF